MSKPAPRVMLQRVFGAFGWAPSSPKVVLDQIVAALTRKDEAAALRALADYADAIRKEEREACARAVEQAGAPVAASVIRSRL